MIEEKFKGLQLRPLIAEDGNNFPNMDYKVKLATDINKIDEYYADKPVQRMYYYPCPTPQDVLVEEHEHIITNSYSGKEIYEWNIDGYSERQIYCWWDNYLTPEQRATILNSVKQEGTEQEPVLVYTIVYSLVLNIVEHFSGRWFDNNETIRTMLQNLRCKTLTSLRWYKDVFLCRVMELPECNDSLWKSKFIDGLPAFLQKELEKLLGKGKLASTMIAILMNCKVKEKIKGLDSDDDLKESLYKILLNSKPEDSGIESDKSEDSSSDEDLRVLENENYTSTCSDEECAPCQMGRPCTSKGNREEDEFYNLFSQFQETNINVLDGNNLVDLLKLIKDPELRSQIIDKVNEAPNKSEIQTGARIQESTGPYTMTEVKRLLQERRNIISTSATTQDLEKEIDNLKKEISILKRHNVILDERISRIEGRGK
ncbi:uncharacterized protein LOC132041897 [Lycium ferocissimum]|uniref:uncharacterized protein LOC132041897 n=1 Tax=Lycium ferocissimum TaxID=112874 RepID=UPI002815B6C3|nr:uncharacterized protein LOC132041897 [Lycium ferocissimum]